MYTIKLGTGADTLTLKVHGRVKPDSTDYWDANWLNCTAEALAGDFRGKVDWQLRNEDLARFMRYLQDLDKRSGIALLDTGDGWLDIQVVLDDQGHVEARCHLEDNPIGGNAMEFTLALDQTALSKLRDQLRVVVEAFPVIGREE